MPPRLARLLAIVVAVGLIVVAFVIRGALSEDDDTSSGDDSDTTQPNAVDGEYRILCDEDLSPVCDGLGDAEVVSAADVLRDGIDADAWVTLDPMPAVLTAALRQEPSEVVPLASTALTLLTTEARGIDCADGRTTCVVEAGEAQKVGVPAATTSLGLIAQSAFALAEAPELNDSGPRALDDEFSRLAEALDERDFTTTTEQVNRYLTAPGTFVGVVTTRGAAEAAVDGARGAGKVAIPLDPAVTIGVVVAGYGGRGPDAVAAVREALTRETLAEAGWDGEATTSTGVPDPDIVYALREELG